MAAFILGIALFFGIHSISIFALPLRDKLAAKSPLGWKAFYALVSLAGLVLLVSGYGELRQAPSVLYVAPAWLHHVAALLLLPTFIFFLAPYFPGKIKNTLKNPQLIAVKTWALAHLLVNGTVADLILFGSFLAWAVAGTISMKRRPQRPVPGAPASAANDVILIVLGLALYCVMALWLHPMLIGVSPFAL